MLYINFIPVILFHLTGVLFQGVDASFNLYVRPPEVKRLLGLNAEVRYVTNGTVNDYALSFVVMVPDHISDLHFTWQSLLPMPIPYTINFAVSDPEALSTPQLNISRKGTIPTKEEVFRLVLRCTGRANAEVEVSMHINITLSTNVTHLVLKRKKICLKDEGNNDSLMIADAMVATGGSLYIAVGCACAIVVVISVVAVIVYMRTMKARRTDVIHYGGSSPALSTATQGHTFLRPDTPNIASSACSYKSWNSGKSGKGQNFTVVEKTGNFHHGMSVPLVPQDRTPSGYSSFKRLTPVTTTTTTAQINDPPKRMDITDHIAEVRIERHKILLQEKLQEGTFGQVYHAIVTDDDVISTYGLHAFVKTVKDQASPIQVSLLTAEGMMMLGMHHKNILPLIGLCTDDLHHPMLVYPYMNQGNLKKFLHRCMLAAEGHCRALTTQNQVGMALQIAQAIAFLHKKKIIHRDIATRNCVVDDALQVKLTDNTLARDLFPMDYHCLGDNENRPIKWLAIESLTKKEFSWASDVWAFGVTLWELLTLGQQPYIEIDPFEMHLYLRDGYRLNPPTNCPEELFALMAYCWEAIPEDRPSVNHIIACLQDFYTALGRFI